MQVPLLPFGLASLGYLAALLLREGRWLPLVLLPALFGHLLLLLSWLRREGGLDFGLLNALLAMSWLLALETSLSRLLRRPTGRFAELFWGIALLALLLRQLFPAPGLHLVNPSPGLAFHIAVSMLAFSLVTIAALLALWSALLDFRLRHPGRTLLELEAPPLERLERLTFRLIAVAFGLLTLSLLSGLLFVEDLFGQHLVHKSFFSFLAWGLLLGLLYGRWRHGWRGRRAVYGILAAFTALFLAYFVSKWVLEVVLARYW